VLNGRKMCLGSQSVAKNIWTQEEEARENYVMTTFTNRTL